MCHCFDTSAWFPLPSSGYRGRPLPEPCGSPPSSVLWGPKTAHRSIPAASGLPWRRLTATSRICSLHSEDTLATSGARFVCLGVNHTPIISAENGSSPAFAGSLFESMPRTGDPGDPGYTSHGGVPDTAFRSDNGVGIAKRKVFGAEHSRPAFSLCTLRHPPVTRRMATLATGLPATALTRLDLHQLDFVKGFH